MMVKAVYIERHGGPEVLLFGDRPDPIANEGEVVVDIHAASINGADWKVRAGQIGNVNLPHILGRDFSGAIAAKGPAVYDLSIGDEVFGVCDVGREGSYAEKLSISSRLVALKPAGLKQSKTAAMALTE